MKGSEQSMPLSHLGDDFSPPPASICPPPTLFSLPLALLAGTQHLPSLPIEPMSPDPNIANKGLAHLPLSSSPHVIFSFLTDRTVSEILRPFSNLHKS